MAAGVKRGEIWTVAGGADYAGKPRPAVILQDDAFDATASITLCPFTSHAVDAPLMRLPIEPSDRNGLRAASHVMIDKITTVSKSKLDRRIGRLSDEEIVRVNRAVIVFLGLAGAGARYPRPALRPARAAPGRRGVS
jgi:mRNA interferase MazF